MASVNDNSRISSLLRSFINDILYEIHTTVPCVVTKVDYAKGTCSAKPLIKTNKFGTKIYEEPLLEDVPIITLSGNSGKAKITFPIKNGDKVIVFMADRDTAILLSGDGKNIVAPEMVQPLSWYPIGALPCFYTQTESNTIDSDKVVVTNEKAKATLSPNGEIALSNDTASVTLASSGQIDATNGAASATLKTSGEINLNDVVIMPDGTLTANGMTLSPSGSMTFASGAQITSGGDFITDTGISLKNHVHSDPQGGNTGTPI